MREPTNQGQPVEVWNAFTRTWSGGFEVAEVVTDDRVRVRRKADDAVLPELEARSVRPRREPN